MRLPATKWIMISAVVLCGLLCLRCDPVRRLGIVPVSYLIGHYERNLSAPLQSGQPERWFSSGYELAQVKRFYSSIFGMRFEEGEAWKRGFTFPHLEELKGRKFELYDIQFEIHPGYYVRLFEGRWVDDPARRKMVLISINNGVY